MAWTDLKAAVAAVVKTNGTQAITGALLQSALSSIIDQVGANATFKGVATPTTTPGTPDGPLFYIAYEKGIYANFNAINITEEDGLVIILYSSNWDKINIPLATKDDLVQVWSYLYRSILGFNLFDASKFEIVNGYLDPNGAYDGAGAYNCTMYIPVSPGETFNIHIVGQPFESLGWVWGYSNDSGSGAIMLQPCEYEVKRTITIPEGINFIRLWGQIGKTHEARLVPSLQYLYEDYEAIKYKTLGTTEEIFYFDLKSSNNYNQSTGELIGSNALYMSGEFVIPTGWCSDIILNYPAAHSSFAVFLYKEDGTYLGCKTAGTNTVIDLKNYDSPYKIIVETYKDWTSTKIIFSGGDYVDKLLSDVAELKSKTGDNTYTKIIAAPNESGQDAIRDILNSITDASPSNQYMIFVPKGRWFECDIQGKQYVKIIGEDRDNTVLYCDGLSTDKFIPENYSHGLTPGTPLSEVPLSQKHCFFAKQNLDVENLTVEVNDVKYCVHLDYEGWSSIKFNNCHFIRRYP